MTSFQQFFENHKQTFQYFGFIFDVDKALKLISKYPTEQIRPTEEMMGSFINVDQDYSKSTDLTNPVIFATVLAEGKQYHILIDGHHRLHKALQENKDLLAITLNIKDTINIMFPNYVTAKMKKEAKRLKLL